MLPTMSGTFPPRNFFSAPGKPTHFRRGHSMFHCKPATLFWIWDWWHSHWTEVIHPHHLPGPQSGLLGSQISRWPDCFYPLHVVPSLLALSQARLQSWKKHPDIRSLPYLLRGDKIAHWAGPRSQLVGPPTYFPPPIHPAKMLTSTVASSPPWPWRLLHWPLRPPYRPCAITSESLDCINPLASLWIASWPAWILLNRPSTPTHIFPLGICPHIGSSPAACHCWPQGPLN